MYDRSNPQDWEGRVDYLNKDRNPFQRWRGNFVVTYASLLDAHNAEKDNGLDHGPIRW